MNDTLAVYHWWDYPGDAKAYANLRSPILLSIASLRAVSDVPIIVLNLRDDRLVPEWAHFMEKLNFRVIGIKAHLEYCQDRVKGWKYLSRLFDIKKWGDNSNQKNIMYVDSDVFWLKSPFPFLCNPEKMCINRWNTGFFYYDKTKNKTFWDMFESYTKSAIYSEEHRELLKKYVGYKSWLEVWDEMTLTYMAHKHPELFNFLPPEEHSFMSNIHLANLDQLKMLHANGLSVSNPVSKNEGERSHCRGLLAITIKEIYDNICKVLNQQDLEMIFTPKELNFYLPKQISLLTDLKKLLATKDANSPHHDLMKCLNIPNLMM